VYTGGGHRGGGGGRSSPTIRIRVIMVQKHVFKFVSRFAMFLFNKLHFKILSVALALAGMLPNLGICKRSNFNKLSCIYMCLTKSQCLEAPNTVATHMGTAPRAICRPTDPPMVAQASESTKFGA